MVMMLCVEGWFLCAERQHATWLFHMRDISFLVSGDPSGQVRRYRTRVVIPFCTGTVRLYVPENAWQLMRLP